MESQEKFQSPLNISGTPQQCSSILLNNWSRWGLQKQKGLINGPIQSQSKSPEVLRFQTDLEWALFTPSTCGTACAPTSDSMHAKTFNLAPKGEDSVQIGIVSNIFQINFLDFRPSRDLDYTGQAVWNHFTFFGGVVFLHVKTSSHQLQLFMVCCEAPVVNNNWIFIFGELFL